MRFFFGPCELDEARLVLRRDGARVPVQPKVLALLLFLLRERERVVPRRELLDSLWADVVVGDGSLARAILELRRAIGDDDQTMVLTVRGFGFRFAAPVTTEAPKTEGAATADRSFVGREVPYGALVACVASAQANRGSFVWVSGEVGIGKTRLVDEAAAAARDGGGVVLVARGHEEPTPPFWAWARIAEAASEERGGDPALTTAAADLAAPEGPLRLAAFERFTRALISTKKTLFLAFDDVQWLDVPSLALLRFFVRETREAPVLVVATHRDTATATEGRGPLLAELLRASGALAIPLRGLSREAVTSMIAARLGREPPPLFARALFDRTGGNPLLVEQLLGTEWAERASAEEEQTIASTTDLRDELVASISRHLAAVSPRCQATLTTAALLGTDFDVAMVVATAPKPAEALDAIDEALRARLLQKTRDGGLRFTHALVGEALTKKLTGTERAEAHARIGKALVAHWGEPLDRHAATLARHFLKAAPTGVAAARTAADLARRAGAHHRAASSPVDAAWSLQLALRALSFVPSSESERLDVLLDLAAAQLKSANKLEARDTYADAALLARALGRSDALELAQRAHDDLVDA